MYKRTKRNSTNIILDEERGFGMDIYSKLLNDRIIFLNGEIDDYSAELVKSQLLYLDSLDHKKDIKLYINSGGGSIIDGLSIIDTMDYIRPDVVTINSGMCASMAAVILCCGTKGKRKALKRSRTMIHQPSVYIGDVQGSQLEIEYKEMEFLKIQLYEIISEKTGQKFKKVHKDCDRDYWLSSEDSISYGLIDHIIKTKKK